MKAKYWFENILLKGKKVVYGTNMFSDKAVLDILKKFEKYLQKK